MAQQGSFNDVPGLIGPISIGCQISSILMGVSIIQTWNYFNCKMFQNDKPHLKWFVTAVIILNISSACVDMGVIWQNAITHFGDYDAIKKVTVPRTISLCMDSVLSFLCQSFFAVRSWKATDRSLAVWIVMAVCILATSIGMVSTAILERIDPAMSEIPDKKWSILMWFFASCVGDWTMSAILILHLPSTHSEDLTGQTQRVLGKLLRMVLTTAGATSLLAVLDAIIYLTSASKNNVHMALSINIPRVFVISVLYTLNSRKNIFPHINSCRDFERDRATIPTPTKPRNRHSGLQDPPGKMIVVTQTQEVSVHRNVNLEMERRPAVRIKTSSEDEHSQSNLSIKLDKLG